jgi:hypothetical protein
MKNKLILCSLLVSCFALAEGPVSVKVTDLVARPDTYDQKQVKTSGKVVRFQQRTSHKGNPYFEFRLSERDKQVNVYGRGTLESPLKDGVMAQVVGIYRIENKVGGEVYKNEIETKPDAIKVLK